MHGRMILSFCQAGIVHNVVGPFKVKLKDIMSAPIITIDADKSVDEAMAILNKYKINRLPVVHDSSIIGIVTTGIIMSNVSIEKHAETEF